MFTDAEINESTEIVEHPAEVKRQVMSSEATVPGFTKDQVDLIKKTIAPDATNDELSLFLYRAKSSGLDPLARQIYFVKRNQRQKDGSYSSNMTIQTSIDGYRAIASRTGELAGMSDVIYDSEDEEHPKKASITVYRLVNGEKVAFPATARWNEFAQQYEKYGKKVLGSMWAKMPYLMLGKCAEALALRKAFPEQLSGIYTTEEMQQAENNSHHITVESTPVEIPEEEKIVQDLYLTKIRSAESLDELKKTYKEAYQYAKKCTDKTFAPNIKAIKDNKKSELEFFGESKDQRGNAEEIIEYVDKHGK